MKPNKAGKIGRREAMQVACKIGLASAGALLLGSCKGSTTPDPEPPLPSVPASVLVRFYNHTQGYLGEKVYSGMSESPLSIKVSDCPDVRTVDANLLAVRESIKNGWLGRYIEFSKSGQLTTTKFPRKDAEYCAFLMNATLGANYGVLESGAYYHGLMHSPDATWDREDLYLGPDAIPREAMRQIKESLVFPWAKYMDFTELQPNVRGDFWVGYAEGPDPGANKRGGFSEGNAWVNPTVCLTDAMKLRVFIESIFGHLTLSYSSSGPAANYEYITGDNGINAIGKDLLAYSLVRDRRSAA